MPSFEELLYKQRSVISSVTNTIASFKKVETEKITYALIKARIETTKERFEQCRSLDATLRVIVDDATLTSHPYFVKLEFAKGEDAYDAALDYLHGALDACSPSPGTLSAQVSRTVELPSHSTLN